MYLPHFNFDSVIPRSIIVHNDLKEEYMQEQLLKDFINAFNELKQKVQNGEVDERELFKIAGTFTKETGGKLSHYNSPLAVGVAVVPVIKDGQKGFVAFKRGIMPFIDGVAFPGGFVNQSESSKESAIRELYEEIGLELNDESKWTHVAEKKTPNNQLLIFYRYAETLDWADVEKAYANLADKSESRGLVFLEPTTEMCFSLHAEVNQEQQPKVNKRYRLH